MKQSGKYSLYRVTVGLLETNCYLLARPTSLKTLIIDPGAEPEKIQAVIKAKDLKPEAILNTHGHVDHIGANDILAQQYHIPVYIHAADAPSLADPSLNGSCLFGESLRQRPADHLLEEAQGITVEGFKVTVIHTPGHTPGSICVMYEDLLFTGDTLFCGSVGRCDLAGGNEGMMAQSLQKFRHLPGNLTILPGHGPDCVLETELKHNPYIQQ